MGMPWHAFTAEHILSTENLTLTVESWADGGSYLNLYGKQGVFDFGPTDANSAQEIHLNQLYLSSAIQLALQDNYSAVSRWITLSERTGSIAIPMVFWIVRFAGIRSDGICRKRISLF
jgi:hypothetical protein